MDGTRKDIPLITIGMCCYNAEDTVGRALDSALAQDWPNFELVVVDDGSRDGTAKIIEEKIAGKASARLIRHTTNKSFPAALNTVIENAKGEFIAIFDDDDESCPDRLSIQHRTITAYEKKIGACLVACWGSGTRRYPNGYELKFEAIGSRSRAPIGTETADFLLFYGRKPDVFYGSGTPSCSLMTRRSTYQAVGPYDETMFRSEDADFSMRLALKGGHFIGCQESLILQHSTGGVEKRPEVTYESYRALMEKYRSYLESCKRYDYAMAWNELRLHHFARRHFRALLVLARLFLRHPILTWAHFWSTAPKRLIHERKMGVKPGTSS